MARFFTLASGSSGNCTYIGSAQGGLLVDAGISCRSILTGLSSRGIDREKIGGVLITHEHSDHIKGLLVLLKQLKVPLYARCETLGYLMENDLVPPGVELETVDSGGFMVGDLFVEAFSTPHDALASVGYRVSAPDGRVISVATDLGYVTEEVQSAITGSDLVLLEANYDPGMLRTSGYPYHLKMRIASERGHLSNDSAAEETGRLLKTGSTRFVLGHLSKENNAPTIAYRAIQSTLEGLGGQLGRDCTLTVAPRSEPGELVIF